MGLSKVIGLNLKKEAFSQDNLGNRDHVTLLKEKLVIQFWKKISDENKDLQIKPEPIEQPSSSVLSVKPQSQLTNRTSEIEYDAETIDSSTKK